MNQRTNTPQPKNAQAQDIEDGTQCLVEVMTCSEAELPDASRKARMMFAGIPSDLHETCLAMAKEAVRFKTKQKIIRAKIA